ncbi:MAG: SpaA isopeptide-forming pilin-related protein, partial [Firmicutes bacterium]|nr:SpaA isopeptide-forming pilin-related protein [Bacillota bacterium]
MKRTVPTRILSLVLSIAMCLLSLPLSAFAFDFSSGVTAMGRLNGNYVGADGEKYYSDSYQYIAYDKNGNTSLHTADSFTCTRLILIQDSEIYQVMCVEAGIDYGIYETYTGYSEQNSEYFQNLPFSAQYGIMLTSVYGWRPGKTAPVSGTNEDDFAMATQTIIWEYQQQLRTSPTSLQENSYGIRADNYFRTIKGRPAEKCYYWILEQMKTHATIPSFASNRSSSAEVYTLKYDSNAKNYSLTLTDTNNTLADIQLDGSGITVTRSGNKYTFTSSGMIKDPVAVSAHKNVPGIEGNFLIWGHPGSQAAVTGVKDPVVFYVKIKTETTGVGRIVKHSEDGKVDGVRFKVSGNGIDKTVTTKSDGTVDVELMPGVYTVTEQIEEKYEPQKSVSLTVVSGKTTTVTFDNKLKRGSLTVTKTSEDGLSEGAKFHLSGTSLSGLAVDEYASVDKDGKAYFNNVLIGSDYTLEEVDIPERYVVPEKQTAAIEWNKVTNKSFENILKKWQLTVTKSDSESRTAQGDATLSGAKYGIYKGDQLVDEYCTDINGQFVSKEYICGDDWTVRELEPSEGYLLDPTVYHIGAEAKLYAVEHNRTESNVTETIAKGKIALIKHCDDGSTQIETPEVGAEFEVFLKSSGNYEIAKESEKDILVCDENGFAQSKDLPYGIYTVRQIKGRDGKELLPPFDVFVKEDGETYRYLINNAAFEALIEIVKKDIETGKVIPASGIGFKVRNIANGEYVVQHINYPTPIDIDIYYTDSTGKLMLPEALPYGNYEIIEQNTCYGYVLDTNPVPFTVDGSNAVVTVEKHNIAQKGTITVSKTGEVFSSVVETDGVYQPVYSVQELSGAGYEITAAEDVYTLDGTLRHAKGDVVAEITTGENGTATTEPLYLGKFEVREKTAPYGMVISDEFHSVKLTYAGQEIEITETATSFYNQRQKASVSLYKVLSQDERFQIGMNREVLSVQFDLFAAEDLTAADGSTIPSDGLLEIVNCDENGNVTFTTDIPVGAKAYVKEIAVDSQYILSDEKYPVEFVYAGQEIDDVEIKANDGEAIENNLIYGNIKGLKIDRETEETIAGALFGLFRTDTTEFTAEKPILTAESGEDGVFKFENIPYGNWLVKELKPAKSFLPNEEIYPVT